MTSRHAAPILEAWSTKFLIALTAAFVALSCSQQHSIAQGPNTANAGGLSSTDVAAGVPSSINAIAGTPYGIAQIILPAGQIVPEASVRVLVTNNEGRIFFPAVDVVTTVPRQTPRQRTRPDRPRIGALVDRIRTAVDAARNQIDPPEVVRVQFLFTGESPFEVDIAGDMNLTVTVTPTLPRGTDRETAKAPASPQELETLRKNLQDAWWAGYVAQAKLQIERSDYPAIIENYMVHMLGRRFGYPVPELSRKKALASEPMDDPLPTIALVAGVESLRAELHRETLDQSVVDTGERLPIPSPPNWNHIPPPAVPADLSIEPVAAQVPPECFYIRFGSFANYLWYQQFGESRGGDLAQLAVLRGFNYQTNARIERMLNAKTTLVGRLFGESVISDMAIIGQDLYLQEGPSMGVLFEAKNIRMLRSSMEGERRTALKQFQSQGATITEVTLEGKKVSLLSTPDNRLRSFMVEKGNYLLLTTSKQIATRFLQVDEPSKSLAGSDAFRFARYTMPTSNDYSVFIYFSSEFFRNLVSPHYQIELRRRLKAIASIEIADMAKHVAYAERDVLDNSYYDSIDSLIEGGYLPPTFQNRIDGAQTQLVNGAWHDSLRGVRGSFLPIADVELEECSREEYEAYQKQAHYYATEWQETDPFMVGIRRYQHPHLPKVEDLVIEAYVAPLGSEKYGLISTLLAEPVQTEITRPDDDMVHVQVHLSGESLIRQQTLDHVLFAGIKDMVPPIPGETEGLLATLKLLRSIPGYIGTWPSPGYLDRLPFGLGGGIPDAQGFSRTLFGLYRWQGSAFSIISFDRAVLLQAMKAVDAIAADDFAQARLYVGDLKTSQVASFFNILSFRRAATTSRGNLMLLDAIQTQLRIPADEALTTAEELLDAKLQCPLGGTYHLVGSPQRTSATGFNNTDLNDTGLDKPGLNNTESSRGSYWDSTAWESSVGVADPHYSNSIGFDPEHSLPENDYLVPWLTWFRGAQLHLTQLPERLVLVGSISMEQLTPDRRHQESSKQEEKLPSMNLDLFSLPFQFFQDDKPKAKSQPDANRPPSKAPETPSNLPQTPSEASDLMDGEEDVPPPEPAPFDSEIPATLPRTNPDRKVERREF